MNVSSQLISAQLENKASDYSTGTKGRCWFNTGSSLAKFDDGSAVRVLVTLDNTQTLTNKTLTTPTINVLDNALSIKDDGDATKIAQFQCSGITTATTRTYTFPDASDTFVCLATTQTLTNKTLTTPVITTPTLAEVSTPSTPSAGFGALYFKSDHLLYIKASTGTESQLLTSVAAVSVAAKSADYTLTGSDVVVLFTTGASNRTATLPAAASSTGKVFYIKKVDSGAGTVIIDGNASETIDGATTYTITIQYEAITIVCDGSAWYIL